MKVLGIVIVTVAILIGVIYYFRPTVNKPDGIEPKITNIQPTAATTESRYIEYSKEALEKSADGRRVLFFYANWCPTCRPADADFRSNASQLPEDVMVIRVNYNDTQTDEQEVVLAAKYQVTYQHTFVQIDAVGNQVTKWNGGQMAELLNRIK